MSKAKRPSEGTRPDRRVPLLDEVTAEQLLGRLVISWNNFEAISRSVLNELCGNPPAIEALTAELGGQNLYNALRAAAPKSTAPELTDVIDELAEGLDRLREHRNYYVHGSWSANAQTLKLKNSSAKAILRVFEDEISKRDLYLISADCDELALYAFDFWAHLKLKKMGQQSEWPDKPFLPPRLVKSHRK